LKQRVEILSLLVFKIKEIKTISENVVHIFVSFAYVKQSLYVKINILKIGGTGYA
jgi:hypothetical protein